MGLAVATLSTGQLARNQSALASDSGVDAGLLCGRSPPWKHSSSGCVRSWPGRSRL